MAIVQSSTPATGARGRRQFPEGFHHDAQTELMRGTAPVTTRPFLPSSSPVRRPTSAARTGRQRQHLRKTGNPNANYYGILADEDEDEAVDTLDALDLEFETRKIIAKEKERMTTRADVLRTFAESIAACARKFDHGYAHAVANDFTKSLLHHWNQFLHSGDTAGYSQDPPLMNLPVRNKPTAARPPTDNQLSRPKTVSFADVTQAASRQAPGDVHIAPARRQPIAASNYADRRILLRLKEGSSFFEKKPFQIRTAIFEKLTLGANDVQNITKTNTGWSVVAWWASVERTEYRKLGLSAELKKIPELSLPRRLLGYLLTARSQHGDFERLHPGQATLEYPYGRQKSPTHLFYCRKVPGHLRARLHPTQRRNRGVPR
ncbi:hypothetical protein LEL_10891 [Akanthomyces lecanii RCEF 1005]|uniref:Uncharacterized protein n=1 Tax=Akanthomyces lecanii RCEF 1005 TaxID=1081108 RepID=A0A167R880_CORDF|nr:hypothetical protein LEL_10891 [Akanthomyces lecanii RCEF 1005]